MDNTTIGEHNNARESIRKLLDEGKPTLATHIHSVWPNVVEALGHTGLYDYVEFVAEYGTYTLHDLDNICRAAELYGPGLDDQDRLGE